MQFTAKYTNEIAYIYAQLIAQYTAQYDEEFFVQNAQVLADDIADNAAALAEFVKTRNPHTLDRRIRCQDTIVREHFARVLIAIERVKEADCEQVVG